MLWSQPGPVVQLVAKRVADPEVMSLIRASPLTFMKIDNEIFSSVILHVPPVISYKRKYVHRVLINCLAEACPGK